MNHFTRTKFGVGTVTMAMLFAFIAPFGTLSMAYASRAPRDDTTLFSVVKKLSFGNYGPEATIATINKQSIFLTGTFEHGHGASADLIRVDRASLTVTARARYPTVTDVAYGDGALWWATGAPLGHSGTSLTPGHGRWLLKVNATNLKLIKRFTLPGPTLLVTADRGSIWVATSKSLVRIDPNTGVILTAVTLGFLPVALAPSFNGASLYVLGYRPSDHLILADYSATSGRDLGSRHYPNFSDGPLVVVRAGVWIPVQSTKTQSTTVRLFSGQHFTSSSSLGRFTFDTEAYAGNGILWLIDAGGRGPTVCANPATGTIRATGSPVGIEYDAMAFDGGSTYMMRNLGANESLLQIAPSPKCAG